MLIKKSLSLSRESRKLIYCFNPQQQIRIACNHALEGGLDEKIEKGVGEK